jgi:mono/diheme cytochrome c family protein
MHPFAIDAEGRLFVDSASATNACQIRNRTLESPGRRPCTELETRGGVWRYDANGAGQTFSPAERYATGIRNGEGFAVDASGIYVTQHGRDQLAENWPKLFTPARGADLPAEELLKLEQGADYGWPECYYDGARRALVLAPEYGGDGATIGACAQKQAPVAAFPAHWAPNALAIYHGNGFPKAYRGGVFIAFHGSWNRAPAPQGGYNIVFQPLADGRAAGDFVVFADGFAGATKEPGKAAHRPSGLAVGPDGSLYVSDDVSGRIWRITFHGDVETTGVEPAPAAASSAGADNAQPPEGVHPDAGRKTRALAVPPGSTAAQVELGRSVFLGRAANGTCAGCHGSDAEGSPIAPDLTKGEWMWSDGSLAGVKKSIVEGVATPKAFNAPMPPLGGARLSDAEVDAVAAYVWAVGHSGR